MNLPKELKYAKEHEWARLEDDHVTVGITDFAQNELGEVVYVELPAREDEVRKDEPFGVIESVKAVSDLYSPATGKVVDVNTTLDENPEKINNDPYGEGWIVRIALSDKSELEDLFSATEYEKYLKEQE